MCHKYSIILFNYVVNYIILVLLLIDGYLKMCFESYKDSNKEIVKFNILSSNDENIDDTAVQ